MARIATKEKAQKLRKDGESIRTIASLVDASKSSVSYWCRDIVLSKKQIEFLQAKSKHSGRAQCIALGEEKRKRRIETVKSEKRMGAESVKKLSTREHYLLGLGLYWGEGYKTSNDEFGFTNSDPHMIVIYINWLVKHFSIKPLDLILRVGINTTHKNREEEIISYWSKLTGVSSSQFTKTSFLKSESKKEYTNHSEHYGTLRIKVRRGMKLKYRVLGALEALA
jgi:hypothetical protein